MSEHAPYTPGGEHEEDEKLDTEVRLGELEQEMGEESTHPAFIVVKRVAADSDKFAAQAAFMARFSNCLKQQVIAIITGNGVVLGIGYNGGPEFPMDCPRLEMETGTGYDLCDKTCPGQMHAEVAAIKDAGLSRGDTVYVYGHTYCCGNCIKAMEEYGIKEIRMVSR